MGESQSIVMRAERYQNELKEREEGYSAAPMIYGEESNWIQVNDRKLSIRHPEDRPNRNGCENDGILF